MSLSSIELKIGDLDILVELTLQEESEPVEDGVSPDAEGGS